MVEEGEDWEIDLHDGISETNGKGDGDGRNEWVGGVQAGPDHDADERVDEELLEEEVALIGLVGVLRVVLAKPKHG